MQAIKTDEELNKELALWEQASVEAIKETCSVICLLCPCIEIGEDEAPYCDREGPCLDEEGLL